MYEKESLFPCCSSFAVGNDFIDTTQKFLACHMLMKMTGNCYELDQLRWLNTVLAVCEYMSFAKSWQEKGCNSQAETWQVRNILMKDFD